MTKDEMILRGKGELVVYALEIFWDLVCILVLAWILRTEYQIPMALTLMSYTVLSQLINKLK